MAVRVFNGLEIDLPEGWRDYSSLVLAPQEDATTGRGPTINLVVKRRPRSAGDEQALVAGYLSYLARSFGALSSVETKAVPHGKGQATTVRFQGEHEGRRFVQTTLLYRDGDDEVAATVTQAEGDATPEKWVEKLLRSVRPVGGPRRRS